ncbi:hypothetical protein [Caldicoprobacter faecalis]|uniref:Uncharacterized protein n=1 Tax=Caldicoprobacter faecalis TaxID=937334 RepID=A0A1I5SG90_9FIRM|nr:hypothetical protein [Caldicoprobacter faecalis]SFP69753.1 hypothetical protein SAMN05444406_102126 [Caldicoprobacter faecalis]
MDESIPQENTELGDTTRGIFFRKAIEDIQGKRQSARRTVCPGRLIQQIFEEKNVMIVYS